MDTRTEFALVVFMVVVVFLTVAYFIRKWFKEHHPIWGYVVVAAMVAGCLWLISGNFNFSAFSACVQNANLGSCLLPISGARAE
jgi:RsiW-degrading membrane proteinase PrsW (M82 family)